MTEQGALHEASNSYFRPIAHCRDDIIFHHVFFIVIVVGLSYDEDCSGKSVE